MKRPWLYVALGVSASGAAIPPMGCGSSGTTPVPPKPTASAQELRDPNACRDCHPSHYGDWAKSMHAYASKDPVFLAMNARGQRETGGQLGNFCVKCHAPVAVNDGMTKDGLNLDSLPDAEKGVTCFFCHSINSVGTTHVNADDIGVASDLVIRGEIPNPQANAFHASMYSPYQDDSKDESSQMCGSCHDITTTGGAHIERTFQEWTTSVFGDMGGSHTSCAANGNCHMTSDPSTPVSIAKGGPATRTFHGHDFSAVDIAFDPSFPSPAAQQATIEANLSTVLQGAVCVNSRAGVRVFLDGAGPGHNWPSGAAQDRRAWVEVVAEKNGQPFYSSGSIPAGTPVGTDPTDMDLWVLRDQMFDSSNTKVDMFWQAACAAGNELHQIASMTPPPSTHQVRLYPNTRNPGDSVLTQMPDKVTVTVHMQPIGLDVLDDLVKSGDLDAAVAAQVTTLNVALPNQPDGGATVNQLVWTPQAATAGFPDLTQGAGGGGVQMSCVSTLIFNITGGTVLATDPPAGCPGQPLPDAGVVAPSEAGPSEAGPADGAASDARVGDAGSTDGGS